MRDQHKMIPPIPRETFRMAKAVFGRSNFYILVGEQLENMLDENQLRNMPGNEAVGMLPILPLVTYFQFVEGLTDAQAEDAVRTRLDWKFALHMAIHAPAFLHNDLCGFRQHLMNDAGDRKEFQKLINGLAGIAPDQRGEPAPPQGKELLPIVCLTNRLNWIFEAMSRALEYLAGRFPELLREIALPNWYVRYQTSSPLPRSNSNTGLLEVMDKIGRDAAYLLEFISRLDKAEIAGSSEVRELRRVWNQQFERLDSQNIRLLPHCSFCASAIENKSRGNLDSAKEGLLNNHN